MNPAQPTSPAASYRQLLDASVSQQTRELVLSLLCEIEDKKDTLTARLGFSKLNRLVRATDLERPDAGPEAEAATYQGEDIVARAAFVAGLADFIPPDDLPDVVTTLFRTGSDREQIGVLRALPLLPDGEGLIALAREASRTNDVTVFCALACESSFPASFLPDAALEQLVLKALFLGVPVARIQGIESRVTDELQRMISDFASERRAAGRPVPTEVPWLLGLPPNPKRTEAK
jgi:hypothetical protein